MEEIDPQAPTHPGSSSEAEIRAVLARMNPDWYIGLRNVLAEVDRLREENEGLRLEKAYMAATMVRLGATDDDVAAAHYANPQNRKPQGPGVKR